MIAADFELSIPSTAMTEPLPAAHLKIENNNGSQLEDM